MDQSDGRAASVRRRRMTETLGTEKWGQGQKPVRLPLAVSSRRVEWCARPALVCTAARTKRTQPTAARSKGGGMGATVMIGRRSRTRTVGTSLHRSTRVEDFVCPRRSLQHILPSPLRALRARLLPSPPFHPVSVSPCLRERPSFALPAPIRVHLRFASPPLRPGSPRERGEIRLQTRQVAQWRGRPAVVCTAARTKRTPARPIVLGMGACTPGIRGVVLALGPWCGTCLLSQPATRQ